MSPTSGCALTRKGRDLYDQLLAEAGAACVQSNNGVETNPFAQFPDDWADLRKRGLAYFHYAVGPVAERLGPPPHGASVESLLEGGWLSAKPSTYQDFLPVSAAGIFRSNLGGAEGARYAAGGSRRVFEAALGCQVLDEICLYDEAQASSLREALRRLGEPSTSAASGREPAGRDHADGAASQEHVCSACRRRDRQARAFLDHCGQPASDQVNHQKAMK
ncbi:2-oxoadipate dioxygenase/decarboxylase family protein [Variovorax rhizosphaerae]|uniref:2-oxoadipate dioxygenase/decarboxylase family protein n=1 Tax=Variovorax rhizosphaerae TaxID=1836200 RepID=UPI003BF570BA